ncbi:MAG: hypothetical protein JSU87_04955 [Gemmatimonadota bacterium]|nr:MAG: hypothetical protein JSU87_04955 [Gemmatimonadota bacterium]
MLGKDVYARIKDRLESIETQQQGLVDQLSALEERTQTATTSREQAYTRLAEIYLPELGGDAVARLRELVPDLHWRLQEILEEKLRSRAIVETQIAETERRRSELQRSLEELTAEIEEKAEIRDALSAAVRVDLDQNTDYERNVQEAKLANQRRLQARRRLDAAIEEREEKTPAYEADVLFGYLTKRGYGSFDYRATVLTKRLDDWVAEKVEYIAQKQNYELLMEAPEVMELEFSRSDKALQTEVAEVEAIEKVTADRHGLTQVLADGESLYQERVALVTRIEELDASFETLVAQRTQLEDTRGRYYRIAIDEYRTFLKDKDIENLRGLARSTETRSDDGLTDEIAALDEEIRRADQEAEVTEQCRLSLALKLKGLKDIQTRFYRMAYDASNSRFPDDFDIDGLLKNYLEGDWTPDDVNRAISAEQHFESTRFECEERPGWDIFDPIDIDYGGTSGGGFGGFGGGGSSTTGGFGGGGSRTTGGFG